MESIADEMDEEDRIQSFEIDGTKMEVRPFFQQRNNPH